MGVKGELLEYTKRYAVDTAVSIVIFTILLCFMIVIHRDDDLINILLFIWSMIEYPSLVAVLALNMTLYTGTNRLNAVPDNRCASCGREIEPNGVFPVCDRCYIDASAISYGMYKGCIPAVEAGMYLTRKKKLTRKVNWKKMRDEHINMKINLIELLETGYMPVILFFIMVILSIFLDIHSDLFGAIALILSMFGGMLSISVGMGSTYYMSVDPRFSEFLIKAHGWRVNAMRRITRAAEMLGMSPEEAAEIIFFVYMLKVKTPVNIKDVEKEPEKYDVMPYQFFYDGIHVMNEALTEDEMMRVARVVEEVWLKEREFASDPPFPVKGWYVFPVMPVSFSTFLVVLPVSTEYSLFCVIFLWIGVFAWIVFSIPGIKKWMRFRGRSVITWILVPAAVVIAGLSGLLFRSGGATIIDVLVDGGGIPWVIGRLVGGTALGMGAGLSVKAVRETWGWIVAAGVIESMLSVMWLWAFRWIHMIIRDATEATLLFPVYDIVVIMVVGMFLMLSGLKSQEAMLIAGIMFLSEYVGILAAVMSCL